MKNKKLLLLMICMLMVTLIATACGSTSSVKSTFPTGKFVGTESDQVEIHLNEDNTWSEF